MEINKSNIFELMNITGVRPSKDYGQNFLIEPTVCKRIADVLETDASDNILEIGPGLGSLTHFINEKEGSLTCVDIDPKMIEVLSEIYKNDNITLINKDIRKVELSQYSKIIGNLPYNITTELVTHLLISASTCREFVFMIQAEALDRFVELSGKEYGPASILVHLIGNIKKEFIVRPGSFYPAPKCNSVVFKITKSESCNLEEATNVYLFAKKIFLNRRKTLLNNLGNIIGKDKAIAIIKELNLLETCRPEEVSPDTYVKMYNLTK
ncbi:MAG: 16S rRNA (adenine(1518)-N(6)/adenine(1519)-N(6))-dimethyltransferase RsmA [Bacilli bacterium]|nr:16S rRNA (adenine(1518)-N(6)/adenine(1519)-N(6))-dimethyltransferase RsmA [Bacilli bacterium]